MKTTLLNGLRISLAQPIAVDLADPSETRWGFHQFPALSRLPDGRLLLTYNDTPDDDRYYGRPGPAYVSADDGSTWAPWEADDPLLTISHSAISEVNDGEYMCVPQTPTLQTEQEGISLPPPCAEIDCYGQVLYYRIEDCDRRIQAYLASQPAARWSPRDRRWHRESVSWDLRTALARNRPQTPGIRRPYIDNQVLRIGKRLYCPNFIAQYRFTDGSCPKNYACWCMVSDDNGRSWQRHGLIAYDTTGRLMMAEPSLTQTAQGELACVIRCAATTQEPMLVTHSADGGATWSPPQPVYRCGVMPQTLLLPNGVLALAAGRPGVWLMFSEDGSARRWTEPLVLVPGDERNIGAHSCGYTRMVPLDDNALLVAYSDFRFVGPAGPCKAVLVRRVEVARP